MKKPTLQEAAKQFLAAREALAVAEAAKKEADRIMREAFEKADSESVVIGDDEVRLVPMPGDRYDAETLRGLVSPTVFKKVTAVTVDNKKLKAAVEVGMVAQDVADTANVGKPFTQIRVYDAKDVKAAPIKKVSVA